MSTEYERQRLKNIEANMKLLESLGLDVLCAALPLASALVAKPKPKPQPKAKPAPVKRKVEEIDGGAEDRRTKIARRDSEDDTTRRRSSRRAAIKVDYNEDKLADRRKKYREQQEERAAEDTAGHVGNKLGKRKHDPKQFGSIPGIEVGAWWETRAQCSTDAIHAPFVAGISGSSTEGAYSVALSGGYDDDVDLGYAFTYTGSGGRDLKGTKQQPKNLRTAPQSSDQTFDNSNNRALQISAETRKPVRVIRGYKLPSKYAPESGYRYDGLYIVEKAWIGPGNNPGRFKVVKLAFKRLPGQPPIPEQSEGGDAATRYENEGANNDTADGRSEPETLPADETSGTEEALMTTHDEEPADENDD